MTSVKARRPSSAFAQRFDRVYRNASLPRVYREFIVSDAYVPYRRSFIRGLFAYDPSEDVEVNLGSSKLLKRAELFDESDIDHDDAIEFHPIATLCESPQFLAIKTTVKAAPVFLWHHETGVFHPQFGAFSRFLKHLRTPKEAREERAKIRQAFVGIRNVCAPALARARKQFEAGALAAAAAELDGALRGRRPIAYDGRDDFEAVGILCDCYNLRGRIRLAQGRLESARAAFLDAMACGGAPYWEAVVDAVVTSFLLEDIMPIVDELKGIDPAHFKEPPGPILERNFTASQVDRVVHVATSRRFSKEQPLASERVLAWVASIQGQADAAKELM